MSVKEESINNGSNYDEWIDEIEAASEVSNNSEYIHEIEAAPKANDDDELEEANRGEALVPWKARSQTKPRKMKRELCNLKSNLGDDWKLKEEIHSPDGKHWASRFNKKVTKCVSWIEDTEKKMFVMVFVH